MYHLLFSMPLIALKILFIPNIEDSSEKTVILMMIAMLLVIELAA